MALTSVFHTLLCLFFFFQAEDGIRDHCVTGVQTCALPILPDPALLNGAVGVAWRCSLRSLRSSRRGISSCLPTFRLPQLHPQDELSRLVRSEERRVERV